MGENLDTSALEQVSKDQKLNAFRVRFFDETTTASDVENGVFRSPDNQRSYLSLPEVKQFFVEICKEHGLKAAQGWHVLSYHFQNQFAELSGLRRQAAAAFKTKNKEAGGVIRSQRQLLEGQILSKMREVVAEPQKYRIDTEKAFPQALSKLDTNEGRLIERLGKGVPDAFHDNGQLPSPAQIYDAAAAIFEKRFPANTDQERRGKQLMKEHLIASFRQQLVLLDAARRKREVANRRFHEEQQKIMNQLASVLHDVIRNPEAAGQYLRYIVTGEYPGGSVVRLPTVEYRIPYAVTKMADPVEREAAERQKIAEIIEKYTDADWEAMARDFKVGSSLAFYDAAGPISDERHLYELQKMLLIKTGEYIPGDADSERAFNEVFRPLIVEVVKNISEIKQAIDAQYQRRGKEGVKETEIQAEISRLRQNLGQERKRFLTTAKAYVDTPELREFAIESDEDPYTVLSNVNFATEDVEEESIEFVCNNLADQFDRMDAYDAFEAREQEWLQELEDLKNINQIKNTDHYQKLAEAHRLARSKLKNLCFSPEFDESTVRAAIETARLAFMDLYNFTSEAGADPGLLTDHEGE